MPFIRDNGDKIIHCLRSAYHIMCPLGKGGGKRKVLLGSAQNRRGNLSVEFLKMLLMWRQAQKNLYAA